MAVLEVTAGNWRAHVRDEDIPRLTSLGVGVVGKYTLVVFRDEETPIPQKNARRAPDRPNEDILRREIAATCGIDPANVQFVFLKQFVRELRQPIHVPLLLKLGLSVSPAPFQIASDVLPYGIPEITPSREEFEQALVVPLNALDDLLRALRDSDHVVLAGEGASGKTSFALSAGHRWVMDGGVALYFDCSNYDLAAVGAAAELIDVGSRFANRRALFVLDNVHVVAPGTLAGAFNAWRKLVEPPKLLSTCRGELAAAADAYGPRTLRIRRDVTEDDFLTDADSTRGG